MLKKLAITAVFGALLLGCLCVAEDHKATASTTTAQPQRDGKIVPPLGAVVDPSPAVSHGNAVPGNEKDTPPDKPLSMSLRPEWVTVFITGAYVLIAGFTLFAIKRQADIAANQAAISVNQMRPRLFIEPKPFTAIVNGLPHIEIKVMNIGGSKAIFGLCIAGMEATGLEVNIASRKPTNSAMLKGLTRKILESGESYEDRIDVFLGARVFPVDLDQSVAYKVHIYGVLNFRDILSEDSWVREFHYVLVSMKNVYMVQLGKMSSEVWTPLIEEEDRRRQKPVPPNWISRAWATCKAWQKKIDAEDQRQPDDPN